MEKNELQIYSIINRMKNNLKLINSNSKINAIPKLNNSRNFFSKLNINDESNFNINKNYIFSNSNLKKSQDNSYGNEEMKRHINSFSDRKIYSVNYVNFNINCLRSKTPKNNYKEYEMKNKANYFSLLNIERNKERKIDFINYNFLLGQKKYFKKIFQHYDFRTPSCNATKINYNLSKDQKKIFNERKLKKNVLAQKGYSLKDEYENISAFSCRNINESHNNYNNMKIKKDNVPVNLNKLNIKSFKYNKRKSNNLFKKEKIIDDSYNEYLKGISSSTWEKNKEEIKKISNKNHKVKSKKLKYKILLYDKTDIYNNIKKIINNNSNIIIKNNNRLSKFKNFIINEKKSLEDINKSGFIENPISRKKITIKKNVL